MEDHRDADLIARVLNGEEDAFQVLCARYEARLKARIRRQLDPVLLRKVSVTDVLQDAYVTAFRRLSDFEDRGEGSFGHWLGKIIENKALHAARRFRGTAKRGAVVEITRGRRPDTGQLRGRGPTPSESAMAAELRARVRAAVERLAPSHREVIRLRQEEGLSIRESAERLGRSPDAVKMLYSRAIARLSALLGHPDKGT